MLKDSLNKKTYIGDIEPNPKEFGIWIKEDGSAKIYDYVKNEWKGSSSNDGGGSSTVEYLDVSGLDVTNGTINKFLGCASLVKISSYGMIVPPAFSAPLLPYVDKIKIDFNEKVSLGSEFTSLKTLILSLDDSIIQEEQLDAIPRITKEQFYSLI